MPYLLVHHQVEDYAKWKAAFDEHASTRASFGSKGGLVLQSADDPNEVVILMETDDLQKARDFTQSDDLRETMQQAGVQGPPHIHFLNVADRPSV